uniref:Uncharacterized protein n=2 Tax=Ciona intestinalis TaxID=7719 RepID=H2XXL2_CIOIN
MQGIEKNLHTKTRDRFTQNLSIFRRDINEILKVESQERSQTDGIDLSVSSSSMMS